MSWERCMLRLAAASWYRDFPATGSTAEVDRVIALGGGSRKPER